MLMRVAPGAVGETAPSEIAVRPPPPRTLSRAPSASASTPSSVTSPPGLADQAPVGLQRPGVDAGDDLADDLRRGRQAAAEPSARADQRRERGAQQQVGEAASVGLGWLPVSGRGTLAHLVLPSITLGAPLAAVLARMTRASVLDELRELYVLAARARGVSKTRAVLRHAVRNSLIPIVTVVGLQFGAVLTGAVITETIFAWPGVGRLLIQSITFRDYPLVQGCILLIAVTYVAMNLLTDVLYGLLDPRIRYE